MKNSILCAFLALLPSSLVASERITVEAKFIESAPHTSIPHDLTKLAKSKGIDLLIAPRVTTKSGHEATVEITRTFRIFNTQTAHPRDVPTGATLRVTPIVKNGKMAYRAQLTVRDYIDHAKPIKADQTHFEFTSREIYLSKTPKSGEPIWVDFTQQLAGRKFALWLQFTHESA